MSDTALDITPTSPAPKVDQQAGQDKPPSSSIYEAWAIGRVNPFAKTERGMTGHTLAKFDLHQEYETYDLLLELHGALDNPHLGKDLTLMAEVIKQKFPNWDKRARELILLKLDDDELRRLKVEDAEKSKGPIESFFGQARGQFLRYKRTGAGKYEKEIIKRKENIRSLLSVKEGDTLAQDKLDKYIQEIRQQYQWYDVSNKEIIARLGAYVSQQPQHIFETVNETMYVYQFVEQVEKSAAYQLGYDLTSGGTRDFDIDFSEQNIDRIAEKETDPRKKAVLKDIGRRFAMNDWEDFWDWASTVAWTGISSYTSAFAAIVANGAAGGVVHPLVAGGIGLAAGAGSGVLEVYLTRALTRKLRNWYFKYPEKGQAEKGTHFKLSFNPGDLHDPDRRDLGATTDPIRQLFQNKGPEETMDFLKRCENFRADLANGVGFHEPETLAGWMDLSDRVLGEAAQGTEMFHRVRLAKKIQQILEQEYRKDTGGHKQLEDLEVKERVKVVTEAFDIISQVEGGETLAPIIKKAMIAKARGVALEPKITEALEKLADAIKEGKQVIHPKENPITLKDKEHEFQVETNRQNRQTSIQARYSELSEQITTEAETERNARQTLSSTRKLKGHRGSGTKKGTGQIGDLEARRTFTQEQFKNAQDENGAAGIPGSLFERKVAAKSNSEIAVSAEAYARDELARRRDEHKRLTKEISKDRAAPEDIWDPKQKKNVKNKDKPSPQSIENKQKEIDLLEKGTEVEPGSIAEAAENYRLAAKEKALREGEYTTLNEQFENNKNFIDLFKDTNKEREGSAAWYDAQIQAAEQDLSTPDNNYKAARDKLKTLTDERDQILQEIFGLDVTLPRFTAPSAEKIGDITKETTNKVTELEKELKELRAKKEAGEALVASDEDKEIERGLRKLAEANSILKTDNFNQLIDDIITGNIKIDDLAKTLSDEGYHLLLKRIFGIDALSQGVNGNYNLTSRILSKGRLAEAIMDVWKLENRATADAFFAGDEAGLQAYQDSQTIRGEISDFVEQVSNIEKGKAEGWEDQVRQLRRQLNNRQIELNNSLAVLYDTRLASLLAQDRVSTAQVISRTLIEISKDAIKGNPFNELLTVTTAGPKTETVTTKQGTVSLTQAGKNERTGVLHNRGKIKAENVGDTGISYEVDIDNTDPEGKINVSIDLNYDNASIAILPEDLRPNLPPGLAYLIYGDVFRRKGGINAAEFDQPLLDTITFANRESALKAGFPPSLVDLLYGPNLTDGKRNITDVMTGLGRFDITTLPWEQENLENASPQLRAFFYELTANKRRTVLEINSFISSLPADRPVAVAAGIPAEALDLIYVNDKRSDPGAITKLTAKQSGITDIDQFEEFISLESPTILNEYFYLSVGESIGRLSASDRLLYLKNKFTTFAITGAAGTPILEATFENGEINVYYEAAGAIGRVSCKLIDFIRMTSDRADNVNPNIVAYINSNPADQQRLIREIGKQAVEAMRKVV